MPKGRHPLVVVTSLSVPTDQIPGPPQLLGLEKLSISVVTWSMVGHLKHQLSATLDSGGWSASGVVASCKHREGRLVAGRVRETVVVPFPRAFVVTAGLDSQPTLTQWPPRRSGRAGGEGNTGWWCLSELAMRLQARQGRGWYCQSSNRVVRQQGEAGINWNQVRPTYWLSAAFAFLASPRLVSWVSLDLEGKVTLFPGDLSLTKA